MRIGEHLPYELTAFVDQVVPILQRRGRFRTEYQGATLRDHLGLARPAAPGAGTHYGPGRPGPTTPSGNDG